MYVFIINMNNVYVLFKFNVSVFEVFYVDINFKMYKFVVFDYGRGGGGLKILDFYSFLI